MESNIEAIEKRLWTAADQLRANGDFASNCPSSEHLALMAAQGCEAKAGTGKSKVRRVAVLVALAIAGCGSKPDNFKQVFDYAKACTERRTEELYSRIAVQDVSDDVVKGIIDECYAEAMTTVGK